ncbi:hypothetical protein BDQ12DRAFT_726184 [Crucibulum laeve]|uniref:Uncharacterized protein n=1 Tax=Crucibulum laeve TaxID=68775 RepID=A0A5C3LTG0_9AGAR|nr:hypothetical protein BDQ12DRAFT_726184 [Crucibulum laeve]
MPLSQSSRASKLSSDDQTASYDGQTAYDYGISFLKTHPIGSKQQGYTSYLDTARIGIFSSLLTLNSRMTTKQSTSMPKGIGSAVAYAYPHATSRGWDDVRCCIRVVSTHREAAESKNTDALDVELAMVRSLISTPMFPIPFSSTSCPQLRECSTAQQRECIVEMSPSITISKPRQLPPLS